jgi:hypothetical protein
MSAPRISHDELNKILGRKHYGLVSSLGGGISSKLGKGSIKTSLDNSGSLPDAEPSPGCEPLGEKEYAFKYTGRCTVRVKVFRKRLCDPDNNMPKWHIDAIRRSRILHGDSAKEMDYAFDGQEKVEKDSDERIEVTIEYKDAWWDFGNGKKPKA